MRSTACRHLASASLTAPAPSSSSRRPALSGDDDLTPPPPFTPSPLPHAGEGVHRATAEEATKPAAGTAENAPAFGVYIHWPFCLSKCPYCDFNSHVRHAA